MSTQSGKLYVVATPIGNLSDITLRAQQVLREVAIIAAEDQRHSSRLLQHLGISTPLISLHEHNEGIRVAELLLRLQQGEDIALISDAGTPLISDPGYVLVSQAQQAGITVHPVPGACAAIAALSASGLPSDRFLFCGFLPAKQASRLKALEALTANTETLIFYEAPHRILSCLQDMQQVFGVQRRAVLAREITKQFETIRHDELGGLLAFVEKDSNQQRGEMVLLLAGASQHVPTETVRSDRLLELLLEVLPVKQAAEIVASFSGEKKNGIYKKALQIKGKKGV